MDTNDIVKRCKKDDRVAQNILYKKYAPLFFSICMRYIKSNTIAEDILVQAFYRIFNSIGDFKNEGSFEGWMKRIVVNECLMELRRSKNFSMTLSIDELDVPIEVEWQDKLHYEELLNLLDQLPDGYRTVFNLYVIEGYKHKEIAEQLGISINTSKSQLILARRKLQSILKKKSISKYA